MKLELKHILPYLPHGLMVKVGITAMAELTIDTTDEFKIGARYVLDNPAYKLILTPLSDLKVSGNRYGEYNWEYPLEFKYDIENGQASYDDMVKLFEDHIDVFGLIEKGLAISKTKTDEKSN